MLLVLNSFILLFVNVQSDETSSLDFRGVVECFIASFSDANPTSTVPKRFPLFMIFRVWCKHFSMASLDAISIFFVAVDNIL